MDACIRIEGYDGVEEIGPGDIKVHGDCMMITIHTEQGTFRLDVNEPMKIRRIDDCRTTVFGKFLSGGAQE